MPTDETIIKAALIQAAATIVATIPIKPNDLDNAADFTARLAWAMWKRFDQLDPSITQRGKDDTP